VPAVSSESQFIRLWTDEKNAEIDYTGAGFSPIEHKGGQEMSKIDAGKALKQGLWWGAVLLAGTALVVGAGMRKRPEIRCAYKPER
jgi:hypothetical protein